MTTYLFETEDFDAREIEVKKCIQKENFLDASLSIYDLDDSNLDDALEDLDTYGLFSDKKIVIIRNIENFKIDQNQSIYDHFLRYLQNTDSEKLLIIEAKKLNHTTKLAKDLKKYCKLVELNLSSKSYIKDCLKDYEVSMDTINLIDEYCLGDFTKITSECEKLKTYRLDTKRITKQDVINLVTKKLGDSKDLTFSFSRSLAEKDTKNALMKYRELLDYQIEPLSIIGLLASQMRIIYQVKILSKRRLSDKEIGNILGEKEFRIKKTRELLPFYTDLECRTMIQKLADIDYHIKTTDTDPNREIELFIINYTK